MKDFSDTLHSDLHYIYNRDIQHVRAFEERLNENDLKPSDVLKAHYAVVDYFIKQGSGEGVGGFGTKDTGLLLSALSRQFVSFNGVEKWSTPAAKAATLFFGLIQNHPFHDANKRTAYLSTVHYLYRNGLIVTIPERDLEDMTVLVANNGLRKYRRYIDLRKKETDPEVRFLSHYFRKNTRIIDKQQYLVTYRELDKILKRYNAWLENPRDNQIDVMQSTIKTVRRSFLSKPKNVTITKRACVLGFPGWTRQVGKGRIKYVREALQLTPDQGVDSQAFFHEVDDMRVLIEMYEGALKRLAFR